MIVINPSPMGIHRSLRTLVLALCLGANVACEDLLGTDSAIIVENNASVSVFRLFIAACSDDDWGEDELGSTETIVPGAEREFGVDAGCWDLRAEFSDASFAQDFGINLDEGERFVWELVDD